MKYYEPIFLLLFAALLISGTGKNGESSGIPENKWSRIKSPAGSGMATAGVSIGDLLVVRGDKAVNPVEVMIILSQKATSPVTVTYSTRDREALAGTDYVATSDSVTFAPGEMMKRITVRIIGKEAGRTGSPKGAGGTRVLRLSPFRYTDPEVVSFLISLTKISGATPLKSFGIITIISDIINAPSMVRGTVHEVQFSATGYTSLYGDQPDNCQVRKNGHVVLSGLLYGNEKVEPEDDVLYTGVLQLDMDMDICSAMRLSNGEDKLCGMTEFGFGSVPVELEIYGEGRGGYIKFNENYPGFVLSFIGGVNGTCDEEQANEERNMGPYKSIASVFNGMELPMLTDRTLRPGPRRVVSGGGMEIAVDVFR